MTAEAIRCHRIDYHRDMYPEFAPESIADWCQGHAAVVWEDADTELHGDGIVLCAEHAVEQVTQATRVDEPFTVRSLNKEDREQYEAGAGHANSLEITPRAALTATHEGWAEAGMQPPEYSSQLFTIAWEWTMARRLQEIEIDEPTCGSCNGAGEDRYETICSFCNGSGVDR